MKRKLIALCLARCLVLTDSTVIPIDRIYGVECLANWPGG